MRNVSMLFNVTKEKKNEETGTALLKNLSLS